MNTLATEFIALIGDAKAGRANEAAIQASMAAILTTGTFTELRNSLELQLTALGGWSWKVGSWTTPSIFTP
jgi:hypothetical protein